MFGRVKPLVLASIDRAKEIAIKKAGVKRIRIHDFRHSHASNLIASGVNIVAVSKRLGHSDVNMTLKVYTHLIKETESKLINYVDSSVIF
ncbi:Tyrosine recombinase XerC [bioreactor metagenome]|uniref:Tyrosine recombinase XerC n=1 Tax=bioreactor metagenome TaxID=1076179 RepID=A0A644Z3H7_9ZZZZ